MSNFVRGSQTTLHFFRMLRQSFKMIAQTTFYLFTFLFFLFLYRHADPYPLQPKLLINYISAKINTEKHTSKKIIFKNELERELKLSHKEYVRFYEGSIIPYLKKISAASVNFASQWSGRFFLAFLLLVFIKGQKISKIKFLRGGQLVTSKQLKRHLQIYNLKKFSFKNYQLAGLPYPNHAEQQHTIITGGSGTGKTQIMLDLLAQIRERGEKVIIYDRMGNFVRKFYQPHKDFILNPLDKRTVNWDLFGEVKTQTDFNIISNSLIPSEKYGEQFWSKAARTVFSQTCIKLQQQGKADTKNLNQILLKSNLKDLHKFLKDTSAASLMDTSSDKTAASVKAMLAAYIESISLLERAADQQKFSIRSWVNKPEQDSMLFLTSRADQHETIKPLMSLALELAVTEMLLRDQEQSKRIWFFIDELPSLQQLPTLDTALAQSRQFGGAFVISLQLMAQLREIYGRDGAESISGLCRNRLFFNSPDQDTANWCAQNLGKKEQQDYKESISYGAHEMRDGVNLQRHKELQNLVIPSEIMNLPSLEAYLKLSEAMPISKLKIAYQQRSDVAEKFEANVTLNEFLAAPISADLDAHDVEEEKADEDEEFEVKTTTKKSALTDRVIID